METAAATTIQETSAILTWIKNWGLTTGIKLVVAIVLLIVGFKLVNKISAKLGEYLNGKARMDKTVMKTLVYVVAIVLKITIVLSLISYLGIQTSGISAIIASAGIGIGMAVNGTLSNLSGGVMLLITRPFSIGDYIAAQGQEGTVQDIHISYTRILTTDKKTVYLPNSILSAGTIVNYTAAGTRRIEFDFNIGNNDPEAVRKVLMQVFNAHKKVLKNPAPAAYVDAFAEGKGTKLFTTANCKSEDYWEVYYDLLEGANKALRAKGIELNNDTLSVTINK